MQMKESYVSLEEATGAIAYNMTNNYMFRFVLQQNDKVLKGLICALLHLEPEQIQKIEILNPINLAGDMTGKEFILDINILLNDDTQINLEMQNENEHNWTERSLSYLCRTFDQLYRGQKYDEALPVFHIGFLDFTLFPDYPEFYATYKMMNVKNYHAYSDKFVLSVLDLNKSELATEEDKAYEIDYWARLFKAKTWEELKELVKDNEYLQEAADSIYKANADEIVRQQCRAREEAERREKTLERDIKLLRDDLENTKEDLENTKEDLENTKEDLENTKEERDMLKEELERLKKKYNEE